MRPIESRGERHGPSSSPRVSDSHRAHPNRNVIASSSSSCSFSVRWPSFHSHPVSCGRSAFQRWSRQLRFFSRVGGSERNEPKLCHCQRAEG
uniref:Uncharacterized protein n=1 Tax=Knipowitschia caucasica TaxID=637954 RepID=A0AAV2K7E5_KNICA